LLFTVDSAKQFLLSKLSEQAGRDGVSLDEIEKRMFLFSEASASPDFEANEIFDEKYDGKAYESKITKLLRKAYAHDRRTDEGKQEWEDALAALRKEDFYGLVMVDQAGIPRKREALWRFELEQLPFQTIELAVIALGFLVVFRPNVLHLSLPDWVRWLAYPLFIWLVWYIGRVWQRMASKRSGLRGR
jgi:hypothetical protein